MSEQPVDIASEELISLEDLRARYVKLCAYRDSVEANIAPLRAQLADAQQTAEKARVYCQDIADRLYEARGGKNWFVLKKNIGILAKLLGGK